METKLNYFTSLLLTALSMAPALAHLLELPGKIHLGAGEYGVVQQIYSGWALLGIIWILATVSNLVLTIITRSSRALFYLNGTALLCLLISWMIFFTYTFPVNNETRNWTNLPSNWEQLRLQWEYSHAVNAVLYFIAFVVLVISVLKYSRPSPPAWPAANRKIP